MTFDEYIKDPMGAHVSVTSNRAMYQEMYTKKWDELRVREDGLIIYKLYKKDDSDYYVHFRIPSETVPKLYYDTVIRLFAPAGKKDLIMESTFHNYQFQAYSNDPSFIYTFAHAFKKNKLFIQDLEYKMSKLALQKKGEVKNPKDIVGYEKDLYFAYLEMKHLDLFTKSRWAGASKYTKSVWNATITHADDMLRIQRDARGALAKKVKNEQKQDNAKKEKELKKAEPPITSKFKSPNIPGFGHFKSSVPKIFDKTVGKKNGFGSFKKPHK